MSDFIQEFGSFSQDGFIFEDSSLSQMGLPKEMINKIHTKEEHFSEKYPRMGHTYRSRAAIPMPYNYYIPAANIEIPEPIKLRGRKSNKNPYLDDSKEIRSEYTDFAWYLQSIPFGPLRIFVVNPDIDFFMFLYDKQKTKGATGEQYAVMAWDPEKNRVIDYGYSELTTSGVDKAQLRGVHDTKGGNTNGKIQEFVRAMTRQGEKKYAPSLEKPLYIYNLPVNPAEEPRTTREERASVKGETNSIDFLRVFAKRLNSVYPRLNANLQEKLKSTLATGNGYTRSTPVEIEELAQTVDETPDSVFAILFSKFRDFRKEIFEEGRARQEHATSKYSKTSGFELEKENDTFKTQYGGSVWNVAYAVSKKKFSPDEETRDPETGAREAQPDKYKRDLPLFGEYASIPSMIKKHTLDGLIDKFAAFLTSGVVKSPERPSLATQLGVKTEKPEEPQFFEKPEEEEGENWLF